FRAPFQALIQYSEPIFMCQLFFPNYLGYLLSLLKLSTVLGCKQQWFMHCVNKGWNKREFSVGNKFIASVLGRSRLSHRPALRY
ncbi:MAG: hypothetical protein V7K89_30095, partial [Nostoc sp.]|uniref:hypothetical protein n=1 Tax=Nostoc sp. TaxID=1180 RepID=UPI002FFB52DC